MISSLFAFASGYALGQFVPGKWRPFVLCLPVSALVYLVTKIVLTALFADGVQLPTLGLFVGVTLLQTPILMLGVFCARHKAKRDEYVAH